MVLIAGFLSRIARDDRLPYSAWMRLEKASGARSCASASPASFISFGSLQYSAMYECLGVHNRLSDQAGHKRLDVRSR